MGLIRARPAAVGDQTPDHRSPSPLVRNVSLRIAGRWRLISGCFSRSRRRNGLQSWMLKSNRPSGNG